MTTESLDKVVFCFHEFSAAENLRQDLVQLRRQLDDWETRLEIMRQTRSFKSVGVPYSPVGMGAGSRHRVIATFRRPLSLALSDPKDCTSPA